MVESLEVQAIRRYLADSGMAHTITATLGRWLGQADPCHPHVPGSYHCRAGTEGPGRAVDVVAADLRALHRLFEPVRDQLAELLGPGDPGHDDHVHIAVPLGTFILWQEDPTMERPQIIAAFPYQNGYVLVADDGAVYCFGCDFKGALRWDGQAWQER